MRRVVQLWLVLIAVATAAAQPVIDIVDLGGGKFDLEVSNLRERDPWATYLMPQDGAAFVYQAGPNTPVLLRTDPRMSLGSAALVGLSAAGVAAAIGLMALWLMFSGVPRGREREGT